MKSRVPLAGYIALLIIYWICIPFMVLSFSLPPIASFGSHVFLSKLAMDVGLTIFLMSSLIFNRIVFIISDLENLLITGVGKWRLAGGITLFILVFAGPLILLFGRAILLFPLASAVPSVIFNTAYIMLVSTFLGSAMLSLTLGSEKSFYALGLFSLLNFSNLMGNPLSMGNLDNSLYVWGWMAFLLVFAVMALLVIACISRKGFAPYRVVRKRRNEIVKKPFDFAGAKPENTSLRLGFLLTYSSAVNNTSTRGPRYSRIRTGRALIFLLACNIAIAAFVLYVTFTQGLLNGTIGDFTILFASIYGSVIMWSAFVWMALAQERIWLLGPTIGGRLFLKNHVIAKSLLFTVLMVPFMIPLLAMALIGHPFFLKAALFITGTMVALSFPSAVLGSYLSGLLIPEQYLRAEMPVSGSLSFFAISVPPIFSLVAGIISYFDAWFLLASIAAMYGAAFICLGSSRLHDRVFYSMIERRFI